MMTLTFPGRIITRAAQQSSATFGQDGLHGRPKLTEVAKESAPVAGGHGGWQPEAGLDFGVAPDQDALILRIEAGSSLFYFDHSR
jgi:hypothetical protein